VIGWLTDLVVAVLGLFLVLDGVAHLSRYRYGETFSALIWYCEHRWPWVHLIVGVLLVVLFTHLEFRVP